MKPTTSLKWISFMRKAAAVVSVIAFILHAGLLVSLTDIQKTFAAGPGILSIQLTSDADSVVAGVPIGIRITASDNTFNGALELRDDSGTLSPVSTGNFSGGQWQGNVVITKAGSTKITASWDALATISTSTFTVKPNASAPQIEIMDGNGQTGKAASKLSKPLKIRTTDLYGNILMGRNVYFEVEASPPGTSGTQLSSTAKVTGSDGIATTELTLGTKVGQYVVRASTSGDSDTFNLSATPATLSKISIVPSAAVVVQSSTQQFSLTAFDTYNNPISLPSVSWKVENGGGTIDANGLFSAASEVGTFANTVVAAVGSVKASASVTVMPNTGFADNSDDPENVQGGQNVGLLSRVEILPQEITTTTGSQQLISAQGYDVFNNALATISYGWEATGEIGDLSVGYGPTTLLNTASLPGTGILQVTASQGDVRVTAQATVRVATGSGGVIEFGEIPSPQQAGTPFTITVTAKDGSGNIVSETSTPIVLSDSTGTISPRVITELSAGVWTGEVTIHAGAEDAVILANASGFSGASNGFKVEGESHIISTSGQTNKVLGFVDNNKVAFAIVAGLGMLGSVLALGLLGGKGLQAIGRNPLAKKQIFVNLYLNAGIAILAAFISIALALLLKNL